MTKMPNHRNVYISLATSMSKTGKFQLTLLVISYYYYYGMAPGSDVFHGVSKKPGHLPEY